MLCECQSGLKKIHCCGLPALPSDINQSELESAMKLAETTQNWLGVVVIDPLNAQALQAILGQSFIENATTQRCCHLLALYDAQFPKNEWAKIHLIHYSLEKQRFTETFQYLKSLLRYHPASEQGHLLAGRYYLEKKNHDSESAIFHLNKAIDLGLDNAGVHLLLADAYRRSNNLEQAQTFYKKAQKRERNNFRVQLGLARIAEKTSDLDSSWDILNSLEERFQSFPDVWILKAKILRRQKRYEQAAELLLTEGKYNKATEMNSSYWYELGRILDKQLEYKQAFQAFTRANHIGQKLHDSCYKEQRVRAHYKKLKLFFNRERFKNFKPLAKSLSVSQPLFIMGFPRSGTTLTEQIIGSHSEVHAAGELPYLQDIAHSSKVKLQSDISYPGCLIELQLGENRNVLYKFQSDYLARAFADHHVTNKRFFTDKMPLNEVHMGLLALLFPSSPKIHLVRHPLDVVFSNFTTELTHGHFQAQSIAYSAIHYELTMDLVEHYRDQLDSNYYRLHYESLVENLHQETNDLLRYSGLEFEEQCLEFHHNDRLVNTASYAQVNQPLYKTSQGRYKPYLPFMEPDIEILHKTVEQLGYTI